MEENKSLIEMRKMFNQSYRENPELFDREDFERVMNNDYTILRYLWHHWMDVSKSFPMLKESMKWRKEFGINQLTDDYFPKEFYLCGAVFPYCPDRDGLKTLFIRIKMIKRIPEMKPYYKKFLIHNINKIDLDVNGKGWVLVVDAAGAGLSNVDLELLIFLIKTLINHFPVGLKYILVNSLPLALTGVWKVAKTLIPSDRLDLIQFSTSRDIKQYIPQESLPDFLGGYAKQEYRRAPTDSPDALEFGVKTVGLPLERVQRIVDSFGDVLKIK